MSVYKASNAETFLKGFSGWLHADGYPGYHRLPEHIRVVGCWAHLRRKFDEAVMDALLAWTETTNAAPKSAQGKAIYYLKEQWPYLTRVLEDGRLELSNNLAERSITPFVIGRKNFLFTNTPRGAQGSAVIYSMIETAKENGLDPYRLNEYGPLQKRSMYHEGTYSFFSSPWLAAITVFIL